MNNLDRYVEEKRKELKEKNIVNELDIIKYIYINLGNKFSFDNNYLPFGTSKSREKIYKYKSRNINDLDYCMQTNTAICKSLSYILEYILTELNIKIITIADPIDKTKYPHVFNIIYLNDGRQISIDLQEDIHNIQTHSFTSNFGLENIHTNSLIINRKEQEEIDKRIGYITKDNYYADDYLYFLHYMVDTIDDFREKVRIILENIDINPTNKMGYIDRQWHHKKILEEFFNTKEFEYEQNTGKIKMYDCFKEINGKKKYYSFIMVNHKNETDIYVYNEKDSKYSLMHTENCVNCIENGMQMNSKIVRGIRKKYILNK